MYGRRRHRRMRKTHNLSPPRIDTAISIASSQIRRDPPPPERRPVEDAPPARHKARDVSRLSPPATTTGSRGPKASSSGNPHESPPDRYRPRFKAMGGTIRYPHESRREPCHGVAYHAPIVSTRSPPGMLPQDPRGGVFTHLEGGVRSPEFSGPEVSSPASAPACVRDGSPWAPLTFSRLKIPFRAGPARISSRGDEGAALRGDGHSKRQEHSVRVGDPSPKARLGSADECAAPLAAAFWGCGGALASRRRPRLDTRTIDGTGGWTRSRIGTGRQGARSARPATETRQSWFE